MAQTDRDLFKTIIKEKVHDIRGAISEIEAEIKERKDIDVKVMSEIQDDIIQVKNRILEVEQFSGAEQGNTPFPRIDGLEKEMMDLEGQKRFEKVSCWRDMTLLRKELRIYLRELNDITRKIKLVEDDSGRGIVEKA